ncbi:MAG: SAM-dependent DNA methyltransferase [Micrococcales bacterium]|nr:SAM-dependent DNA methyltransferase [Micrococcales bacterium]
MALKKSDLYSSLWKSADELRGGMDASQYKDYVLTLLFVKYVSDKAKSDPNTLIEVPDGGSFDDLVALKGKPNIGEQINIAIRKLAEANDLQGVINKADFDESQKLGDGKEKVDRLSNLIGIYQDIDFTGTRAEGDDLLGDAYEYLMRHFATESGKSKGQFYTPAEVSRVMAQLLQIPADTQRSTTVYDPTCGSGSLLIKVADAAPRGLTIYGQEKDEATWALARMNMILHGNTTSDIRLGDTLANPRFKTGTKLDTFDYLVANPPFSVKTWQNGFDATFGRFDGFAEPPAKNGDYAFLLHMLKSLKSTGRGAVILPHGVLFRGNAEATIRRELIERGYIKAIIGLPANLFYGTGIPACIILLDKKDAAARTGIFMIDASRDFEKDGPKNRLRPRDMHKIVDAFLKGTDIPRYARMVPKSEIADPKNNYNLNIPRYIDSSEPEDIQDLHAHLKGGIPNRDLDALQPYWDAFPSLRSTLFRPLRDGYSRLDIDKSDIQQVITNSAEYQAFASTTHELVSDWWASHRTMLEEIGEATRPGTIASQLGETLLDLFRPRPLLDEYGAYEQFMSYWNETMHDDVALVVGQGWAGAAKPRKAIVDKERKLSETADLVVGSGRAAAKWKMDLIPPQLIVARYFAPEATQLDELNAALEAASESIEEFVEENSGEDGPLADTIEDDKITKALATARLRIAKTEYPESEEVDALTTLIELYDAEAAAKRAAKDAAAKLEEATLAQYGKLTEGEIKSLVIADKWGATVAHGIETELSGLIQKLVDRLQVLADRYEVTVSDLDRAVEESGAKVASYLAAMGVQK